MRAVGKSEVGLGTGGTAQGVGGMVILYQDGQGRPDGVTREQR